MQRFAIQRLNSRFRFKICMTVDCDHSNLDAFGFLVANQQKLRQQYRRGRLAWRLIDFRISAQGRLHSRMERGHSVCGCKLGRIVGYVWPLQFAP